LLRWQFLTALGAIALLLSIVYAALEAFGADAEYVPEYVARALSTNSSTVLPSTSSGNDGN